MIRGDVSSSLSLQLLRDLCRPLWREAKLYAEIDECVAAMVGAANSKPRQSEPGSRVAHRALCSGTILPRRLWDGAARRAEGEVGPPSGNPGTAFWPAES
jgi:hypothetical protein